jgi:hypothetical protein
VVPIPCEVYVNGHNLLAAKLRTAGIGYRMLDNAFLHIDDWEAAQKLADESDSRVLHEKLDHYALLFRPPIASLGVAYQWNLAQVEYATDIVFSRREDLAPIYETLVRTAVHSVKACSGYFAHPSPLEVASPVTSLGGSRGVGVEH